MSAYCTWPDGDCACQSELDDASTALEAELATLREKVSEAEWWFKTKLPLVVGVGFDWAVLRAARQAAESKGGEG